MSICPAGWWCSSGHRKPLSLPPIGAGTNRPSHTPCTRIKDLHVIRQSPIAQRGGVLVHSAADGALIDRFHALAFGADPHFHQPAGGKVQAFVYVHLAGKAVGTQDLDGLKHIGAVVLVDEVAGGRLHHAVEDLVGLLTGDDACGHIVHAQQQSDHLADTAAVEGGHLGSNGRAAQRVGGACHRNGSGSAGRGRHLGDAACGTAGIDPQGLEALAVVVDVVFVQLCGAGDLIVAVDAGRDEGSTVLSEATKGPSRLLSRMVEPST